MKIAYVNVFVSDLKRAVQFYETKLGLTLEHSAPEHGYASLRAGPIRQPWGGFMALLADPDGNVYYLDEVASVHA